MNRVNGRQYLAYMLRLWLVEDETGSWWRALLEDAHTGQRVGFADIESLVAYLEKQRGRSATARKGGKEMTGSCTSP